MNFFMLCATLGEEPCQTRDGVVSRATGRAALGLRSVREASTLPALEAAGARLAALLLRER